eukprot:1154239-Pelagomonas_calceolata.AAC.7
MVQGTGPPLAWMRPKGRKDRGRRDVDLHFVRQAQGEAAQHVRAVHVTALNVTALYARRREVELQHQGGKKHLLRRFGTPPHPAQGRLRSSLICTLISTSVYQCNEPTMQCAQQVEPNQETRAQKTPWKASLTSSACKAEGNGIKFEVCCSSCNPANPRAF